MNFGNVIEFRKDIYFEGAVQADWFYNQEKSSKVAENYIFTGKEYFNNTNNIAKIDTITFIEKIADKFNLENYNPLTLTIADYGTGKSHLAVTLGHLFSGPTYCPDTYNKIIENIKKIDNDDGENIKTAYNSRNFVLMLNGITDFNLNAEIFRVATESLKLYNIDDSFMGQLSTAFETARTFLEKTADTQLATYEQKAELKHWPERGNALITKLQNFYNTDPFAFDIINDVYHEITGQNINWQNGITAKAVLDLLVSELCGSGKPFDHIIILFDEFGRFLEYVSSENNSSKTGDEALQQILEAAQNSDNKIQIINFIQSDIKTYLTRVDATSNINRYIGRYDASDRFYIASNLEMVFANLIQRKKRTEFDNIISKIKEKYDFNFIYSNIPRWFMNLQNIWKDHMSFFNLIVEGLYPLHPISTYVLTHLSNYLQSRSSLAIINSYIEKLSDVDIETLPLIMPEELMKGDLFQEMLSAENSNRQNSRYCTDYNSVLEKVGDRLSEDALKILRANLVIRLLKFNVTDKEDLKKAIAICTNLDNNKITNALEILETEYAVLAYDNNAKCFDFVADSTGKRDYTLVKNQKLSNFSNSLISKQELFDIQIIDLFNISDIIATDFSTIHKIPTNEWNFTQKFCLIEDFNQHYVEQIITEWNNATSYKTTKGQLIWIYFNRDTNTNLIENIVNLNKKLSNKPIILMLLNDSDNKLINLIIEYKCLEKFDNQLISKFNHYYKDDLEKTKSNITETFKSLTKNREYITTNGPDKLTTRVTQKLSEIFNNIYTKIIPFNFDIKLSRNYQNFLELMRMLLSASINYDNIQNCPIDFRNQIMIIFSEDYNDSWKCLNNSHNIVPPKLESVRKIYDDLALNYSESNKIILKDIFLKYSQPPYGLNDEAIMLLISLFVSNNTYGTKFCLNGNEYSINSWKEFISTHRNASNERDIIISNFKNAIIIRADINAIASKFINIFDRIENNHNLRDVAALKNELETLSRQEEIPEELRNRHIISEDKINSEFNLFNQWKNKISELRQNITNTDIDGIINIQKNLINLPRDYNNIYDLYNKTSNLDSDITELSNSVNKFLASNFDAWLKKLRCNSESDLYKLHGIKESFCPTLRDAQLPEYADKLENYVENLTKNIDGIRKKETLIKNIKTFIDTEHINENTSIQRLQLIKTESSGLLKSINDYNFTDKDIDSTIFTKLKSLCAISANKINDFNSKLLEIQDNIQNIKDINSISILQNKIRSLFNMGLNETEYENFTLFITESEKFLKDFSILTKEPKSLEEFNNNKDNLINKYRNPTPNFNQLKLIENKIDQLETDFEFKDMKWRNTYLNLPDTNRSTLIKWKETVQILPYYISDKTKEELDKKKKEVETLLSSYRIDVVIDYFNLLSPEEKKECINRLSNNL